MGAILRGEHALVDGNNTADVERLRAAGYEDDGPFTQAGLQAAIDSGMTPAAAQHLLLSMPMFFAPPANGGSGRPIFRVAERTTGRRIHTTDEFEKNQLVQSGAWIDEGIVYRGGSFPATSSTRLRRVFQLLQPAGGGRFLTVHQQEREAALRPDAADGDSIEEEEGDGFGRGGGYIDVHDGDGNPIPLGDEVSLDPVEGLVPIHRMFKRVPTFRLHVRIAFLASGTADQAFFDHQIARLREILTRIGMALETGTDERGSISTPLTGLEIGACEGHDGGLQILTHPTADQEALFSDRQGVPRGDMVAYFIRSTVPPVGGCAASPIDKPSLIVTRSSTEFTLAHEVGHVLGLSHAPADQPNRLMNPGGGSTDGSDLTAEEIEKMKQSFRLL